MEVQQETRPTFTLAVYDSTADGTPKDLVYTLTTPWPSPPDIPGNLDNPPNVWFPAPSDAELDGDTDYHVAIQTPGGSGINFFNVVATGADAETGAPGWTIEDAWREDGSTSSIGSSLTIAVRGRGLGASFGSGAYTATEGGAAAEVTVTLAPPPESAVEVPLTVQSRQGGANATDHSPIPASLSFPARVGRRSFTVTATDDTVDEVGESITLALGTLPEGYSAGAHGTATVSLQDNDESVYFDASAYTATEGGTDATVTATLSVAPPAPIQVPITVTRNGAGAGDYSGVPAMLSFAAMQTTTTFTVAATDDAVDDDGESISIALGDPPLPYVRGPVPETTVALIDDDVPLAMNGEFSTNTGSTYTLMAGDFMFDGMDGDLLASVKIVSLPNKGTLTLDGSPIAMTDVPKTVTRAELDEGKLVYTPPATEIGDDLTSFTFRVNDGTSDSAVYTMTVDVDSRSTVLGDIEINFGAPAYTAMEGGTAATVEVVLSRAPTVQVRIPLGVVSHNWGAVAADHAAIATGVTFATTDTRRTFTVTATDDSANDDGESVTIGFGTLPMGYAAGRTGTATVSLADNDGVLVSNTGQTPAARSSANLGDSNHGVKFTTGPHLSGYVLDSIEVTLTNTGNSAVSRSDLNSGVSVSLLDTVLDSTVALFSASTSLGASTTATVRFTPSAGTTLRPSHEHNSSC